MIGFKSRFSRRLIPAYNTLLLVFLCSCSFLPLCSFQGIWSGRDSAGDSSPVGSRRHGLYEGTRSAQRHHVCLPVLQLLQQQVPRYEHICVSVHCHQMEQLVTAIILSAANPPSMKRLNSITLTEPAQKRPPTSLEDGTAASEVRLKKKTGPRKRTNQQ